MYIYIYISADPIPTISIFKGCVFDVSQLPQLPQLPHQGGTTRQKHRTVALVSLGQILLETWVRSGAKQGAREPVYIYIYVYK